MADSAQGEEAGGGGFPGIVLGPQELLLHPRGLVGKQHHDPTRMHHMGRPIRRPQQLDPPPNPGHGGTAGLDAGQRRLKEEYLQSL